MATAISSILLSFILTGLITNWLVQSWQQRNWLHQQRFLGEEKEYEALKELWMKLAGLASRRLWRMRRLLYAIRSADDELVRTRLADYDSTLSEWNEQLSPMFAQLTLLARWALTKDLERQLQYIFVISGYKLETLVKMRLAKGSCDNRIANELEREFNSLSRRLFIFNRDTLRVVQHQRTKTYNGVELEFNKSNLEKFGNWELLKALFKPGKKRLRVIRSPSDI